MLHLQFISVWWNNVLVSSLCLFCYHPAPQGSIMSNGLLLINVDINTVCILYVYLVCHWFIVCLLFHSSAAQCDPLCWIWIPGQLHHDCCCKSVSFMHLSGYIFIQEFEGEHVHGEYAAWTQNTVGGFGRISIAVEGEIENHIFRLMPLYLYLCIFLVFSVIVRQLVFHLCFLEAFLFSVSFNIWYNF